MLDKLIEKKVDHYFPYDEYRENQRQCIIDVVKKFLVSKKKFVFLDAPTGTGKSVIGYTVAKVLNAMKVYANFESEGSVMLTKTKALQRQYVDSFPDMKSLWSQVSYSCHVPEDSPYIPHGTKLTTHKRCRTPIACDYDIAKKEFAASEVGVLNYAFYNTSKFTASDVNILVCDEAHTLDEIILGTLEVNINERTIRSRLHDTEANQLITYVRSLKPEHGKQVNNGVIDKEKIQELYASSLAKYISEHKELSDIATPSDETKIKIGKLESIIEHISFQIDKIRLADLDENWVSSYNDDNNVNLSFKPVEVNSKIYAKIFNNRFVLVMSASFCGADALAESLNIDKELYDVVSVDYVFPLENRPFINIGLPSMNYNNRNSLMPSYVEVIDTIIEEEHMEQCGIIHSVSYTNAKFILEHSKFAGRILIPDSSQMLNIRDYMKDGRILVSPAISEGIDLEGKLSEFQIFLKVPYPNLSDPWISRKLKLTPVWYARQAVMTIIQGSGRSIRGPSDTCTTYMLDGNFEKLYGNNPDLFPDWFKSTIIGI